MCVSLSKFLATKCSGSFCIRKKKFSAKLCPTLAVQRAACTRAPLSLGFPGQECRVELPFSSPGEPPTQRWAGLALQEMLCWPGSYLEAQTSPDILCNPCPSSRIRHSQGDQVLSLENGDKAKIWLHDIHYVDKCIHPSIYGCWKHFPHWLYGNAMSSEICVQICATDLCVGMFSFPCWHT